MRASQQIFRARREYNIWVGNETLEDYALRFTAKKSRHWSLDQVAITALGATAFMALEAIAAAITLNYGFVNAVSAMVAVAIIILLTGFPIAYAAARHGLDIDLLTRGAGFGYLGSTLTSFIYASFTFIFFAIEAGILASALQALLGIPLPLGYVICALAVIPVVTHGITAISKFQVGTQNLWLALQLIALLAAGIVEFDRLGEWMAYAPAGTGTGAATEAGFSLALFGASAAILFSLAPQIGEQVDYLRFMPPKTRENARSWWFWLSLAGPGWILIGLVKMLLGSFLAWLAFAGGSSAIHAADPTYMYQTAFAYLVQSPTAALIIAGVMVLISQMKINVTNAYAGSIAWSNFFSRLTHSHPGRVVWLVFNVAIALTLMELGIHHALESILGLFAIVALSWLGSLAADLIINKPLGLSPPHVEFKRGHLYDVNPVGVGSMLLASTMGVLAYFGTFGEVAGHLAHFISLAICFLAVPAIAVLTKGRYYLARQSPEIDELIEAANLRTANADEQSHATVLECCICENAFEREDMSFCPAYQGAICSLCCSLDSRCMDSCKTQARFSQQLTRLLHKVLPKSLLDIVNGRLARFLAVLSASAIVIASILGLIYYRMQPQTGAEVLLLQDTMINAFFLLLIVCGVIAWLFLLTHESRVVAQQEATRQTQRLMMEIDAHDETDKQLQQAKELAERSNQAKSRYLTGISHELRTPLHAILGYAQLLSERDDMPERHRASLLTIKRSSEYLADLIEGLLDISKIEAGRLDIYRNTVNLPELIDQLIHLFRDMAIKKGIDFNCHICGRLPELVITDEKRLRQILINLLSNAIKYTEEGRVDFRIRYRSHVAEFAIEDTGVGIHGKDLQRILDPFERVRGPGVPNVSGSGLGLTIVRLLTDIMGGELKIRSIPGVGSCFTASLMLSPTHGPVDKTLPRQRIDGYHGPRRVVMIVDDEPVHRGLLSEILRPLGFTIVEASDASSCRDLLLQTTPHIFLLDVSMPGSDGLQLAKLLRKAGYKQPIVMISADAQERHRNPREVAFHDGYLVKPVNNQQLLDCIGHFLRLEWTLAASDDASPATLIRQSGAALKGSLSIAARAASAPVLTRQSVDHVLIRELIAYAQIGYKKGVNEKLEQIAAAHLLDEEALRYFKRLAASMRFDRLVESIELNE
ncbi:hybrid sensor histidine kinase/response regulator [Gilvimarinus sp. F26214L]|uniref:hybrid sensor histidine kinase/response regulator n=1 Tax=Gilvimarinus sp. DZF01 TaxID=3461371 RepID=UPI004045BEC9